MNSSEIRKLFLDFFKEKKHKILPSSPLVLKDDPSVLFTTAGMQPLKPYFSGFLDPQKDFGTTDLASIQKCLRTSDIDDVGDSSHLTFFEMLGNFSIGGYGKEEAIKSAYEFLIEKLKLEKSNLLITVFAGDKDIPEDGEAYKIWQKVDSRLRTEKRDKKENFWGPTGIFGPCGPSSEILFVENGLEIELWNLVFTQFYLDEKGKLSNLGKVNIDTGMGLERLAKVVQKKPTIYETDLFYPTIGEIENSSASFSMRGARIIADHLKSAVFLIAEGVLPSNVERGYVLRRLIRRAIRYANQLDLKEIFSYELVKAIVDVYGESYPELKGKARLIYQELNQEVERFRRVVQEGLKMAQVTLAKKTPISPRNYTKIMQAPGKKDIFRYFYRGDKKELAKFGVHLSKKEVEKATIAGKEAFDLYQSFGFPPDMIIELAQEKRLLVDLEALEDEIAKHRELSKKLSQGKFRGGLVDESPLTIRGHTATHLLHQALRDVLGNHVHQTGSNITQERLRFDFAYGEKLTSNQIKKVEEIVNQKIKENLKVTKALMTQEEADRLGAIGLFKEKYGNKVKIYKIGNYSIEYCGGPHAKSTSGLRSFKIVKEESAGAGVRRIYAKLDTDSFKKTNGSRKESTKNLSLGRKLAAKRPSGEEV